jgi:hypothetical protein
MNTSRLTLLIGVVIVVIAGWLFYSHWQNEQFLKSLPTLAAAVKRYSHDQIWRGRTPPPTVGTQDLVEGGYLFAGDARGLVDKNITFYFVSNENDPKAVLVRVKLSDGSEVDALADGSVQTVPKP